MQKFEVTVKEANYVGEMEAGIRLVSTRREDEYFTLKRKCSTDVPDTVYIARVATAIMSKFCAYVFPRYDITIHLGKPHEPYYYFGEYGKCYEIRVHVRGVMNKIEQARLVEELNRIVGESQMEAMS